ncbi:hypothetical protein Acsp04_22680 [Actinomadura sp. NBRC 104425]|uniref:hypothetical protein n=1 Tax=Actinomadura sp. NBRC 104425 TaxID=3032204 RepID=UPI0024A14E28|nr:hypothetical protein [Actinomadura sp. NBRC 104425]GLZ12033.1 hypothetical protein Acsp04_22680 [Actinomadura sp. NBRC 104425]
MVSVLIALSVLALLALGSWLSQMGSGVDVELWERGREALRTAPPGGDAGSRDDPRTTSTGNVRVLPSKFEDDRFSEDDAAIADAPVHAT